MSSLFEKLIKKFGIENQIDVSIEEMAELTKELIKRRRGKENLNEIREEIADVFIMLCQLMEYFGLEETESEIDRKIERIEGLIND